MFTIVAKPRAWWPVSFLGVSEEGEIVTNTFEMQFFVLKVDEVADFHIKRDELGAAAQKRLEQAAGEITGSMVAVELVRLIASNWRGVAIEDQGEVPWNDDNLRALLNVSNAFDAVLEAWRDCMNASPKIHAGN